MGKLARKAQPRNPLHSTLYPTPNQHLPINTRMPQRFQHPTRINHIPSNMVGRQP